MSDFFIWIYSSRGGGVKSMKLLRGGRKHIQVWKPLVYTHSVRDRETGRPDGGNMKFYGRNSLTMVATVMTISLWHGKIYLCIHNLDTRMQYKL
jgi:hypothetical protein